MTGRTPVRRRRRNLTPLFLVGPATVITALIFIAPLINGVLTSFRTSRYGILSEGFSLDQWQYILTSPAYGLTVIRTFLFAIVTTVLAIVVGFAIAYYIVYRSKRGGLLTLLIVTPLLLNAVVLGIGWLIILNRTGAINSVYTWLTGNEPLQLLYTPGAVVVGLFLVYLPYMVLSLISTLRGIDTRIAQSARSLGASPFRAFWDVTFPLSLPGILSGSILVFSLCAGVFVIPAFLGGSRLSTLSLLAYEQSITLDFPLGVATAMVLLVALVVVILVVTRLVEGGRYKEVFNRASV